MNDSIPASEAFGRELREAFSRRGLGHWQLATFASVSSTMDAASALFLRPGARAAVFALSQGAGRGREGRSWSSESGCGVYVTYALHSARDANISGLSLAAGLAVVRMLASIGISALVKWPNDVLAGDGDSDLRKISGVLVDLSSSAEGRQIQIGIGLNLEPQPLPEAVSIRELMPDGISYTEAAVTLTMNVERTLETFFAGGFPALLEEYEQVSALRGRRLQVTAPGKTVDGAAEGVAGDGALLLRVNGSIERIYSGTVRILEP